MNPVKTYAAFAELPERYGDLLKAAAKNSFYLSLAWFDNLTKTTDQGQGLRLYGVECPTSDRADALFVTRRVHGSRLTSCTNMYSILYGPICRQAPGATQEIVTSFVQTICSERPTWNAIQFDSLDKAAEHYDLLVNALKSHGLLVQTYFHFGVQFEDVSHGSYDEFLRRRPSALRNTLKRKAKKLEQTGRSQVALFDGVEGVDDLIAAYERVYTVSWKDPEPFPDFTAGLIRTAAAVGCLRAGVIYVDDKPAAAQIWIVAGGRATIYKLAYNEKHARLSLGSILTARLMHQVIEVDGVREVDFGRGDDPYKSTWLSQRREHWGILAFNPRTPGGLLGASRHIGGRVLKKAVLSVPRILAKNGFGTGDVPSRTGK